jgi:uncharacterized membrane protein YqaE (UPF0057 family)
MSKIGNDGSSTGRKIKENIKKRKENTQNNALSGRGPIGLFVAKLIDIIILIIKKIFEFFVYKLTIPVVYFTYDLLFSGYKGVFAGKDKDGECYNSSIFRYIITILAPPVGVFMSKGISGWPSIIISTILTFFHMFPGIIYALVVTYNSRYADRYQDRELQMIKESREKRKVNNKPQYTFPALLISIGIMAIILYLLMKFAKLVANFKN